MRAAIAPLILIVVALAGAHGRAEAAEPAFSAFLVRFSAESAFRAEHISVPLRVVVGDGQVSEVIEQAWDRKEIAARLIPPLPEKELRHLGLEQQVTVADGFVEVFQFRPEADSHRVSYYFRATGSSWTLAEIRDESR